MIPPMLVRRAAGIVLVAGVGAALVACSTTEDGTPSAGGTDRTSAATTTSPSTGPSGSTSPQPSSTSSGASPLAGLDPCTMLAPADAAALGFTTAGRRDDLAGLLRCVWTRPGQSVRVVLAPERAMADTNNGSATKVEDVTVGGHSGRLVEESSGKGYCEYDLVVSDTSHATVASIVLDGTTQQACALAQQAVTIVEPKLP